MELMEEHQPPLKPGDVVSPKLELWTLLKGHMRAQQQMDGDKNFGACCCLSKDLLHASRMWMQAHKQGQARSGCDPMLQVQHLLEMWQAPCKQNRAINHHCLTCHGMSRFPLSVPSTQSTSFQGSASSCADQHLFPAIVLALLCMGLSCIEMKWPAVTQ